MKFAKGAKRPIFRGFMVLGQGVIIQKPKNPRELIAGPMAFVWTYFLQFRKDKIRKGPKEAHF